MYFLAAESRNIYDGALLILIVVTATRLVAVHHGKWFVPQAGSGRLDRMVRPVSSGQQSFRTSCEFQSEFPAKPLQVRCQQVKRNEPSWGGYHETCRSSAGVPLSGQSQKNNSLASKSLITSVGCPQSTRCVWIPFAAICLRTGSS